MEELRERIDSIDRTIVNLLNDRAKVALCIGETKRKINSEKENVHVYVPGREKKVFEKVRQLVVTLR